MPCKFLAFLMSVCLLIGGCSGNANWLQGIQFGSNPAPVPHWTAQVAAIPDLVSLQEAEARVLREERPVFVLFYSRSCEPCRKLAPSVASLHEKYAQRVRFFKVEAPAGQDLRADWGVQGDPTVLIFRDGAVSEHILGRYEAARYEKALDCALGGEREACSANSLGQCGPAGCSDTQPTGPSAF